MKVALIGAHGTFKTTLIYFLAGVLKAKGKSVGIIREVVRSCPYFRRGHGNILAQNWILLTQSQLEREYQDKFDFVICDRSLIDNFIYAREAYLNEDQELPQWIEPFVMHHAQTYNFLFKTPVSEHGLIEDQIRSTDKQWQLDIDSQIKKYLKEKEIKYVELPKSEAERFDEILDYATRQAKFMANKIIDMDVQTKII
ncbi:MAG: ATP-binding protein [Nanoarchaeota archaeon]|nr:ATP-binding protein [Nanoarchaeota archaeon]